MNIFIKTYGCQMNARDSEALAGMLAARGHTIVGDERLADAMIFNTCSVRDQAERKAIGKLTAMKQYKKFKPGLIIGVAGCMAQNRGEELLQKLAHLDFAVGTGELHKIPDLLESLRTDRRKVAGLSDDPEVLTAMGSHYRFENDSPFSASIAITRGCNRFCSYCIVPYVRGREISRELADIRNEALELVGNGVREILLLGQNVAAYGWGGRVEPPPDETSPFADLLEELAKIDGLERIRFTSPYPTYFNRRLIAAMAAHPKVCRNVHLPLQSGSQRILEAMNRQYTPGKYLEIVAALRTAMPEITFSTDVIVGFPGETAEDFAMTRELLQNVGFDHEYIFKYSPRQGTRSAQLEDTVPEAVKLERNKILLDDLERRNQIANQRYVGTVQSVMTEGPSPRNPARWSGRTGTGKTVIFLPIPGIRPGDTVDLTIHRASRMSLFASGVIGEDEEL